LAILYQDNAFQPCQTMGEILQMSLKMLEKYPMRKKIEVRAANL
jgi:hypothetical protein